jgi:hypothetical protein
VLFVRAALLARVAFFFVVLRAAFFFAVFLPAAFRVGARFFAVVLRAAFFAFVRFVVVFLRLALLARVVLFARVVRFFAVFLRAAMPSPLVQRRGAEYSSPIPRGSCVLGLVALLVIAVVPDPISGRAVAAGEQAPEEADVGEDGREEGEEGRGSEPEQPGADPDVVPGDVDGDGDVDADDAALLESMARERREAERDVDELIEVRGLVYDLPVDDDAEEKQIGVEASDRDYRVAPGGMSLQDLLWRTVVVRGWLVPDDSGEDWLEVHEVEIVE